MRSHTRADSQQAAVLPPEFIDRYAVVGPPAYCVERLQEIRALGVDKVIVIGPSAGADRDEARVALDCFSADVAPAFAAS